MLLGNLTQLYWMASSLKLCACKGSFLISFSIPIKYFHLNVHPTMSRGQLYCTASVPIIHHHRGEDKYILSSVLSSSCLSFTSLLLFFLSPLKLSKASLHQTGSCLDFISGILRHFSTSIWLIIMMVCGCASVFLCLCVRAWLCLC